MSFSQTLNKRVELQRRTPGRDGAGQPVDAWPTFETVWADIRVTGGLETIKANADVSKTLASIRLRYRTDLDASIRAVHGAVIYEVRSVQPDMLQQRHVDLVCEVIR